MADMAARWAYLEQRMSITGRLRSQPASMRSSSTHLLLLGKLWVVMSRGWGGRGGGRGLNLGHPPEVANHSAVEAMAV